MASAGLDHVAARTGGPPDQEPAPVAARLPATAGSPFRRQRLLLSILLAGFVLCAASYSVAAPLWEASDESEHFQYVVYLLTQHRLPSTLPSIQPSGNNEGNQPPLYYLLVAPLASAWTSAMPPGSG